MALNNEEMEALRQMVGSALTQMGRDLDGFHRKAKEASSPSGGFKALDNILTGMTKTLLGPVGLAAGFYAVSKSLESVATASVQMQAFANNTGFTVGNVNNLAQGMRRMGIDAQDAQSQIAALGAKLNDVLAFKEGSALYQSLSTAGQGGIQLFNRIKQLVDAGNQMGAVSEVLRTFNQQTRAAQIAMSQYFGLSVDVMQNLAKRMEDNIPVYIRSKEANEEYLKSLINFQVTVENIWAEVSDHGVKAINELGKAVQAEGISTKDIVDGLKTGIDLVLGTLKQDIADVNWIVSFYRSLRAEPSTPWAISEEIFRKGRASSEPGHHYGDPGGPDYGPMAPAAKRTWWQMLIGAKGDATGFGGGTGPGGKSLAEIEDDSNKLLRDIRDTLLLDRMGGEGSSGPIYGSGISGGNMRAGLGGFRPMRGSRGASSGGDTAPNMTSSQRETASIVADEWRKAGMSEAGIAGVLANIRDESRFNPNLRHFDQPNPRFRGTEAVNAHGLYQEGGDEWNNYDAWLQQNHPGANWKDPRLQSEFAAQRLKTGYPATWKRMQNQTAGDAAATYVDEYLKPAAGFRSSRMARYRRGVPGIDAYTGGDARNLIDHSQSISIDKWNGAISASVEFLNVPPNVRTNADADGDIFKQLQISKTKQAGVYRQPSGYE